MSNRSKLTQHYPVLSCFLLVLSFACGSAKGFLATGAALVPALVIRLQGHSSQKQNNQKLPEEGRIETPQTRLWSRKRILRQESYFGKQRSLTRAFRGRLGIDLS